MSMEIANGYWGLQSVICAHVSKPNKVLKYFRFVFATERDC